MVYIISIDAMLPNAALLYQRSRWFCEQKITASLKHPMDWCGRLQHHLFYQLQFQIERFTEADCSSQTLMETLVYFQILVDEIVEQAQQNSDYYRHQHCLQSRDQPIADQAFQRCVEGFRQAFVNFLADYDQPRFEGTVIPYRRSLSQAEVLTLSQRIQTHWQLNQAQMTRPMGQRLQFYDCHQLEQDVIKAIAESLAQQGILRIFALYHHSFGQEMAIALMDQSFAYDDRYWFSASLDWLLYAEGHGYVYGGGKPIMAILSATCR